MTDTTPLLTTPGTKAEAILSRYPELTDTLASLSDRYRNLASPILRKTVTPHTPPKLAAQMGGADLALLANMLCQAIGQPPLDLSKQGLYASVYLGRSLEKEGSIATRSN